MEKIARFVLILFIIVSEMISLNINVVITLYLPYVHEVAFCACILSDKLEKLDFNKKVILK